MKQRLLIPILFLWLVLVGSVLSYSSFSVLSKLRWILAGYGLPFLALTYAFKNLPSSSDSKTEPELPTFPPVFWIGVIFVALFFRFGWLVSFHRWPISDDAMHGFIAMSLAQKWSWDPDLIFSQLPPLYFWLSGFFFKRFPVSLEGLWLFPALISALTALAAYGSARVWFGRRESLWWMLLWSCSFWPVFIGRFNLPQGLFLFWEIAFLGALGVWRRSLGQKGEKYFSLFLGFGAGMGAWTQLHWYLMVPLFGLAILHLSRRALRPSMALVSFALGAFCPVFLLFLMQHAEFGRYLLGDTGMRHGLSMVRQIIEGFRYPAAVFWGAWDGSFHPKWGGFLNPILGALALLGCRALPGRYGRLGALWIYAGILCGFIPGFLTAPVEYLRCLPAAPFLLISAVEGIRLLLRDISQRRRTATLIALMGISVFLDFHHLVRIRQAAVQTEPDGYGSYKSIPQYQAFRLLEPLHDSWGAGWVGSYLAESDDPSLAVATRSWNPPNPDEIHWIALLLERGFAEGLKNKYPRGLVLSLENDPPGLPGDGLALFLLRRDVNTEPEFGPDGWIRLWREADQQFQIVTRDEIAFKTSLQRGRILQDIQTAQTAAPCDPILNALVWLRIADFYHQHVMTLSYDPALIRNGDLASIRRHFLAERVDALRRSCGAFPVEPTQTLLREAVQVLDILTRNADGVTNVASPAK